MLAIATAFAVLILAAAKPQRTVAVPVERAQVVLATDASGSMRATDVKPTRLDAVKKAALGFVDQAPRGMRVGVLAFNGAPSVLQSPTRDREAVRNAIEHLTTSGATATGEAIAAATQMLRPNAATPGVRRPPAAILLLSDGTSTRGRDPVELARVARRAGVRVHTIALGTAQGTIVVTRQNGSTYPRPVPPDPAALAQIAKASGGTAYTAATQDKLSEIYQKLGSELGHRNEHREITVVFAACALALLLAGMAMSVRWFGRLI
jgi:Ca-activated chloride channel family protein